MPIIIDKATPAFKIFTEERIFVMDGERAENQRIRPIEIAILNLTPTNEPTETQFLRLLANSPLQVNITLVRASHLAASADESRFGGMYKTFNEVETKKFDGMIITGVPVGIAPTEKASKNELQDILEWTTSNVTSTLFVGDGAHEALHYFYRIRKHNLKDKSCGVFAHQRILDGVLEPLMRGICDEFQMPHSRRSIIYAKDIMHVQELKILAYSKKAGASIIKSVDNRRVFITGHLEYDRYTLKNEYERDLGREPNVKPPVNYFADKDMCDVKMSWISTANLFYINWLNYYVYQLTPYDINEIEK